MSHHFEQISKTQLFQEVNGDDTAAFCRGEKDGIDSMNEEKDRMFIMEICLHCADISNPYKPFKLCEKWALLIVEEFALQGDREKREGLEVSPMMDRSSIQLCNMQMGFIEFVVAPLIIAFINIFPPCYEMGVFMADNYCSWGEKRKLEIAADDKVAADLKETDCAKLDERMTKFREKLEFCDELRNRPSRGHKLEDVIDAARSLSVKSKPV